MMTNFFWVGAAFAAAIGADGATGGSVKTSQIAPARDGNIAIRQELCAARKAGTMEAYDLFIARHPDHPLAEIARRERARLLHERQQQP